MALTHIEKCILHALLSASGPLSTNAIRSKCNIKSTNSCRVWLNRLKKRGFVINVGYVQEANYFESLWAITESGAGILIYVMANEVPLGSTERKGSCHSRLREGGDIESIDYYVQRVYVDGSGRPVCGERSVFELVRLCGWECAAEVGVSIKYSKRLPKMWFQIYTRNNELRVESRVKVVNVADTDGFSWVNVREWYSWVKRLKDVVDFIYYRIFKYGG